MLKKLEIYDVEELRKAAEIEASIFEDLQHDPNGLETVRRFREGSENIIRGFDARWTVLCDGSVVELTEWASRMRLIRGKFDELDRQLAVADRPRLVKWHTVGSCMGAINAFRVAIEQVLDHSEAALTA